jgi:hypothetical protein
MPIGLRAHKQYALKLFANPAHTIVFKPEYTQKYETKLNVIPPFGLRVKEHISEICPEINRLCPIT